MLEFARLHTQYVVFNVLRKWLSGCVEQFITWLQPCSYSVRLFSNLAKFLLSEALISDLEVDLRCFNLVRESVVADVVAVGFAIAFVPLDISDCCGGTDGSMNLQELKDKYIQNLIRKRTRKDHYRKVDQRLRDGLTYLGWSTLSSISKRKYQAWIQNNPQWSPKTKQHYQSAFKSFCQWLFKNDYLPENPLANVESIENASSSAPPVAALTPEEASSLLQSVPQYRHDFYAIMIYTGLRAIEVNRLRVKSVSLNNGRYWVKLEKSESKAQRVEILEVPKQLEPLILRLIQDNDQNTKLLPHGRPSRKTFRNDLETAGIDRIRFDGSCVSLHSLRKTFVTLVTSLCDSSAAVKNLARHTSEDLTQKRYTDRKALNYHQIVDQLPHMLQSEENPVPIPNEGESTSQLDSDNEDSTYAA